MTQGRLERWIWFLIPVLAWCARAQGTFNASNNYIPSGASRKAFIADSGGNPVSKTVGRVAILTADLQYLSPGGEAGVALLLDGLFFINGLAVPGVPTGGSAQILVQAWDSSTGSTYNSASRRGSALVTIGPLGGGTEPAATFAANSNFIGLQFGFWEPPPPPPPPLSYRIDGGFATITSALRTNRVVIPATLGGWTVGRIAPMVFAGRPEITNVTLPDTLIEIGDAAFAGCRGLTEVRLPSGLLTLGAGVFESCSSLAAVQFPSRLQAIPDNTFGQCLALTQVELPVGVTRVGHGAFQGCSRLARLTLPEGLEELGDDALSGCSSLSELVLPPSLRRMGARTLRSCTGLNSLEFPEGLEEVGDEALRGLTMSSLWIPAGLTRLGRNVFRDMSNLVALEVDPSNPSYRSEDGVLFSQSLQSLIHYPHARVGDYEIPPGMTDVEPGAFAGRSKLTGIGIPATVTRIGASAFTGCPLAWASLPSSLVDIGDSAFEGCPLVSVTVPSGVRGIGARAFADCAQARSLTLPGSLVQLGDGVFAGCVGVSQVAVPGSVTNLPPRAFEGCTRLARVVLGEGIRFLGARAFAGCGELASLQLPQTLELILDGAFDGCVRLERVAMPLGLKRLGDGAFRNNTRLVEMVLPSGFERLGSEVFGGCTQLRTLYFGGWAPVMAGSLGAPSETVIYHVPNLPGWSETWNGVPTREWLPDLTAAVGTQPGAVPTLTVDWADGQTVILMGSDSLEAPQWQALSTNRLSGYKTPLADPEGTSRGGRFYRVTGP